MRATSETQAPGSSDAATSRSFSSCDHRRRRSTDVITSALEIVIALLLGLPLGLAAFASVKQGGPQRRNTVQITQNIPDKFPDLPQRMVRWHTLIRCDVRKQAALVRKPAAHDRLHRFEMIK